MSCQQTGIAAGRYLPICTNSQFVLLTVTGHRACFECKHLLCLGAGGTDL